MAEAYSGVKFNCRLRKTKLTGYDEELRELIATGKKLAALGMGAGNQGNVSVRVERGFIIKATGTELGKLGMDDFALVTSVDLDNFSLAARGLKMPSSEAITHYSIYNSRPDANAIVHAHNDGLLRKVENGEVDVPVTEKQAGYGTPENARVISELLRSNNFIAARGHGFFAVGKNLGEAVGFFLDL